MLFIFDRDDREFGLHLSIIFVSIFPCLASLIKAMHSQTVQSLFIWGEHDTNGKLVQFEFSFDCKKEKLNIL